MKYTDPNGRYSWAQFKTDIIPSINFDFGRDYTQFATQAWRNGSYFQAAMYELDATCELTYDSILFCFTGYKIAQLGAPFLDKLLSPIIEIGSMLVGTLASLCSNSTVVLGTYEGGAGGGYVQFANKIGATCFQIPDRLYKILDKLGVAKAVNSAWLKQVINSGARIILNSDPSKVKAGSSYAMEIEELSKNFTWQEIIIQGEKCWEVISK